MDNSTQHYPTVGMRIPAAKRIAYYTLTLTLLLFAGVAANAQYATVAVSGLNADVIADGATAASSTTADVDGTGYYFFNTNYSGYVSGNSMPTSGLFTSIATATPTLTFQLASASANNSLRLLNAGPTSGALVFTTPRTAGIVYVLNTSGSGASTVNMTVVFTDSTSQAFGSQTIPDWYNAPSGNTTIATTGVGRLGSGGIEATSGTTPHLCQTALALLPANYSKLIAYVSFTQTAIAGPVEQVMAISVQAACVTPTAQPTALTFPTVGVSQISGSYTAATGTPTGYVVVRYPSGATPVTPVNGTTYTAGTSTLGTGVVDYVGTNTTFTSTGLTINTNYTYYIYSYNNTVCAGGPLYDSTSVLTGSQATNSCGTLSGVIPVGPTAPASPAGFPNLTAASTYINNNGLGGATTLELQSNYTSVTETFPISFVTNPCISATKKVTIRPAASATGLVITNSTAFPTIDLNGAQYVTIDGRPGGVGTTSQLSIINTNTANVTVRFINDASNNKITYCDIQGQNTANAPSATVAAGVVFFSTANSTTLGGNDNDTLSYCNIHATTGGTPAMGIVSYGTTTTVGSYNDNSVITNCNIYDFFLATSASTGVKLDVGNNAWSVTNNSVYQTAARAYTTAATHRGLWITPGTSTTTASGFSITGNYIGGSQALAGGTAYTMSGAVASAFSAMDISVGNVTTSGVESNTITNINLSTSNSSTTSLIGINLASGNVDCGSGGANTIGSAITTGAIVFTSATTSGGVMGIRTTGGTTNTFSINNNIIAGITLNGSSTSIGTQFAGINAAGGTTININNNTIGSATIPNSINIATAFSGTSGTAYTMQGIWISSATTTTITGNLIANMNTNYTATGSASSSVRGIYVNSSITTVANNTIRNLSSAAQTIGTGANCPMVGMAIASSTGANLVTGNTIHSLKLTGATTTASVGITGIFVSVSSTLVSTFSKNFIHSFYITAANNFAVFSGFDVGGGRSTYANNMIRLGIDSAGADVTAGVMIRGFTKGVTTANNYYYNSVYIGGNNVLGAQNSFAFARGSVPANTPNDSVVNNIFVNARSNASGATGKHYAVYLSGGVTFLTLSNNLYYTNGTGGTFGATSSTVDVAAYAAGWAGSDANSVYADPHFKVPAGTSTTVDLHITTSVSSPANNAALAITAVTTDFDGDARSATTPDIGADEFVGSTLPVTLVNFQGQKQGSSNLLSWTTATEINSSDFELQRGIDGTSFTTLTVVASKAVNGNSSTLLTYQSTDAKPLATDNYYRLKLVDKDGSFTYSSIVLLKGDETNSTTVVSIYPNPVADHLNIVITAKENNKVSLIVNDMNGRVLSSQYVQLVPGTNSMQVNVSSFAKGTYAVKIVTADGQSINTSLFVK